MQFKVIDRATGKTLTRTLKPTLLKAMVAYHYLERSAYYKGKDFDAVITDETGKPVSQRALAIYAENYEFTEKGPRFIGDNAEDILERDPMSWER